MRGKISFEGLRWLILGLLFFSTVINYVDRQALSVLLAYMVPELGPAYAATRVDGGFLAPSGM